MSCKNNSKKKKALRIIGVVFLVIVLVLCIIGFRFRSHIKAAIIFLTTSDEDIQKNIEAAKEQQSEILNSSGLYANKEADDALMAGEITAEQHTQILLGNLTLDELKEQNGETDENIVSDEVETEGEEVEDNAPEISDTVENVQTDTQNKTDVSDEKTTDTPNNKTESVTVPETPSVNNSQQTTGQAALPVQQTSDADKRIAELVTKMYVLKSEYTAAIDGIIASMKAEYTKLPQEQKTRSAKQNIATSYLGQINAMEIQCDAQVNAIVSELKQILKDNGRDMSLADAIASTYATEKENTKAYYLSTYGD